MAGSVFQAMGLFLLACAVIFSRRPEAVLHPQFYAEDGHVWYADAYNMGWWAPIFRTYTGYFTILPRLGGALALLVSFAQVPLFMNLVAIAIQALPVSVLLSPRSTAWGPFRFRALLAIAYLALPNSNEVSYGLTVSNFLLALVAMLLLLAKSPQSIPGKFFDCIVFLLCGLTGPFCIFFLPISLYRAWKEKDRWQRVPAAIFLLSCTIQSWALLFLAPAARARRAFGASAELALRILGGQVYLGALLGGNGLSALPGRGVSIALGVVALLGTTLIIYCIVKAPWRWKVFVGFSALLFASALKAPVEWGRPDLAVWNVLAASPGHRYWFFPTLAFVWVLLWGFHQRPAFLRGASALLLSLLCLGIVHDWHHRVFPDSHFADSAQRFNAAPAGATVIIPETPDGWSMQLVKHTSYP